MKHTPGRWYVAKDDPAIQTDIYIMQGKNIIAYVDRAFEAGNAHLMAAAPKLLEMLKEVTGEVEGNYLDFMDEESVGFNAVSDIVNRANKIIAKAEGK